MYFGTGEETEIMLLFASYLELKYMGKNDVILLAKIAVSS